MKNKTLTIRKAQEIFEQTISSEANIRGKADTIKPGLFPGDFTPVWGKAKESADSFIESVDMPIIARFSYRRAFKDSIKNGKYLWGRISVYQKLLIVFDKRNQTTGCFIISLIPTKEYYKNHKNDVAERFLNCGLKNDFSGIVLYSTLKDNRMVRVNVVKDGQTIKAASVFNRKNTSLENFKLMQSLIGDGKFYRIDNDNDPRKKIHIYY